jgi:hypothetical protein
MNNIYLTEEEQEEFDREVDELEEFIRPKSKDIPDEYAKSSEAERFTHHDYDGIEGTYGSWLAENGELIDDSNPFDEDANDY